MNVRPLHRRLTTACSAISGDFSSTSRVVDTLLDLRQRAESEPQTAALIDWMLATIPGRSVVANEWWSLVLDELERGAGDRAECSASIVDICQSPTCRQTRFPARRRGNGQRVKVWIDQDLCTGDGLCFDHCPAVFTILEDGIAYVQDDSGPLSDPGGPSGQAEVPVEHEEAVVRAALFCPGECIFIEIDSPELEPSASH